MTMPDVDRTGRVDRRLGTRSVLLWGGLLLAIELAALGVYLRLPTTTVTDPLVLVYPFVWINVGIAAVATTTTAPSSHRQRRIATVVGIGYFLLLAGAGGVIAPGHAVHGHEHTSGLRLVTASLPPGWGPALLYGGAWVTLAVFPYQVIGYLALAYLVGVTVIDAAGSAMAGLVGLFSCVSCAWPILGTVLTGVFGGASAVAGFATAQPYGASTLVFLTAVGLLYWRPLR